jgi:transposase
MKKNNLKIINRKKEITIKSLIVGIDIGSEFHSVVFQNKDGMILDSINILYNSRRGFDYLDKKILIIKEKYNLDNVHIGFEPTGHYWKNIIYHLSESGHRIHFIRTTAVKSQRELDESSPSKTDIRDANTIASLVREGKYLDSKIQFGVFKNLRDIGKLRAKVMEMKTSMICRLTMLVQLYFPELLKLFWATDSVGFWRLLKQCQFPTDIKQKSNEELKDILKVQGLKQSKLNEMIQKLREASENSIGLRSNEFDRFNIMHCISNLEMFHNQLKEIKIKMEELLEQIEYWKYLKSINGVGVVTAATLLGELGEPSNFKDSKEIIKFAGLDPKEKSSGKYRGKIKLSKKGRYLMRTMIYFISMRLVHRDEGFKAYYEYKLRTKNRDGRFLEKKEALMAVGIKFIKVIFAMFRDKRKYEGLKYRERYLLKTA